MLMIIYHSAGVFLLVIVLHFFIIIILFRYLGTSSTMNQSTGSLEKMETNTSGMQPGRFMLSQRIWLRTSPSTSKDSLLLVKPDLIHHWTLHVYIFSFVFKIRTARYLCFSQQQVHWWWKFLNFFMVFSWKKEWLDSLESQNNACLFWLLVGHKLLMCSLYWNI